MFPYRSEMYSVKMLYGCRLKFSTLQAVKIVQFIMRLFPDSSEQMGVLSKLSMLRRSFETALDLIDAIALEYYFINNTIDVKTKLAEGHSYMFGTYIQNALEYILDNKIVHHDSMDEYKILCKHLKKSDKPISVVLDLLYKEDMYMRCKVTAKTVYGNGKRIKSVIVIESTGLDVKP